MERGVVEEAAGALASENAVEGSRRLALDGAHCNVHGACEQGTKKKENGRRRRSGEGEGGEP